MPSGSSHILPYIPPLVPIRIQKISLVSGAFIKQKRKVILGRFPISNFLIFSFPWSNQIERGFDGTNFHSFVDKFHQIYLYKKYFWIMCSSVHRMLKVLSYCSSRSGYPSSVTFLPHPIASHCIHSPSQIICAI